MRPAAVEKPVLLFFYSQTSGSCRRVEGFLAQVLQRRQNHASFAVRPIERNLLPELFEKFEIEEPPALVVVHGKRVRVRLEKPRGCAEIQTALAPWLR